jgi:hypothetical protein
MNKKISVTISIDPKVWKEFRKSCIDKEKTASSEVQNLMEKSIKCESE